MLERSLYASVDAILMTPKTEGLPTACQVQSAVVLQKNKSHRGAAGLLCGRPTNVSSPFDFLCHISKRPLAST